MGLNLFCPRTDARIRILGFLRCSLQRVARRSPKSKTTLNSLFAAILGLLAEGLESCIVTRAMVVFPDSKQDALAFCLFDVEEKGNTVKTWLPPQLYAASKRRRRHWIPRELEGFSQVWEGMTYRNDLQARKPASIAVTSS